MEDHLPHVMAFLYIPVRCGDLAQRIDPVYDGLHPALGDLLYKIVKFVR
jgi:hypothetical protein